MVEEDSDLDHKFCRRAPKMVTTLTAQMFDLLAPVSKSATRTKSTFTNGSVHGISLV